MQTGDNCEVQQSAKTCNLSVFLWGRFAKFVSAKILTQERLEQDRS